MASAVEPISVDNDSVIYEHIIPRSVRQKWMRRTSTGHLDLILTSARECMNLNKPEQIVVNSLKSDKAKKGLGYGDSIVSRDVQNFNDNSNDIHHSKSESLITPEEEQAVFTAFGVKLRHTGTHISVKPALELGAKQIEENGNSKQNLCGSAGKEKNSSAQIQLRNITKKPRPLSMPTMTDKTETNYQIQADNVSMSKPKPKAYISPHAKVPWKRNITKNTVDHKESDGKAVNSTPSKRHGQENSMKTIGSGQIDSAALLSNESKSGMGKVNDLPSSRPDRYRKVKLIHEENHLGLPVNLGGKPHSSDILSSKDVVSALQSVSDRKKPFEKQDGTEHTRVAGSLSKYSVEKSSHNGNFCNEKKLMLNESGNKSLEKQTVEGPNIKEIDTNNKENIKSFSGINRELYDQQTGVSKDTRKPIKDKYSSLNENHRKLLDMFQGMPVNKPDYNTEKSTEMACSTERNTTKSLGNESNTEIDKNISLTVGRKYEKKIKKMMIMTGEQRDRELKSKNSTPINKKVPKGIKIEIPHKSSVSTDTVNRAKVNTGIPVTNLDDTIPVLAHNNDQGIPITNLDDLPAPNSSSNLQAKTNKTTFNPRHLDNTPPKKPGKYDADRRALVAPKVVFDSPVTGLLSALSPKEKANRKVCKLRFLLNMKIHYFCVFT